MSRNPYFPHLPTWRNRQDLAYALDSLPHILTSYSSSSPATSETYPSPPATSSYPPSYTSSSWSSISSSSSSSSFSSCSTFNQQQRQHHLIARHLYSPSLDTSSSILQFSTRTQAMSFLIDILQSLQSEPCGCDLVQGCFCSPEGVEDHSGMAPCYICGEWYAEQVYCQDEETMEAYRVDGRRWHEQGGASLRHSVAEARVRRWLDQVVVPPQQYWMSETAVEREEEEPRRKPIMRRCATTPASFLIPQEILDPSCRSPGFRIKSSASAAAAVETPMSSASNESSEREHAEEGTSSSNSSSSGARFNFSFTSERFRHAIRESIEGSTSQAQVQAQVQVQVHDHEPIDDEDLSQPEDETCGIRQAEAETQTAAKYEFQHPAAIDHPEQHQQPQQQQQQQDEPEPEPSLVPTMLTMVAREVAPARHCPWEAEVEPRSEFGNLDHSDDCLPKEKKRIESDRFSCSAQPTTPTPSPVYTCALLPPSSSQELSRALAHAQSLNTTASFGPSKTVSVSLSRNRNRNRNNLRRGSIARLAPEENSTLSSTDATEALMGSSTSWASATASWRSISTTLTALLLRFTPMQHSSGGFSHWVV